LQGRPSPRSTSLTGRQMAFTLFLFPRSDSTAAARRAVYVTTHRSTPLNGTQRAARAQQSFRARRADHTRSPTEVSVAPEPNRYRASHTEPNVSRTYRRFRLRIAPDKSARPNIVVFRGKQNINCYRRSGRRRPSRSSVGL